MLIIAFVGVVAVTLVVFYSIIVIDKSILQSLPSNELDAFDRHARFLLPSFAILAFFTLLVGLTACYG